MANGESRGIWILRQVEMVVQTHLMVIDFSLKVNRGLWIHRQVETMVQTHLPVISFSLNVHVHFVDVLLVLTRNFMAKVKLSRIVGSTFGLFQPH